PDDKANVRDEIWDQSIQMRLPAGAQQPCRNLQSYLFTPMHAVGHSKPLIKQ
ncbi:hypothetical protein P7K49_035385, partial [Saguinus oedipus]